MCKYSVRSGLIWSVQLSKPQPNRIDAYWSGLRYLFLLEDSVRVSAPVRFMPTSSLISSCAPLLRKHIPCNSKRFAPWFKLMIIHVPTWCYTIGPLFRVLYIANWKINFQLIVRNINGLFIPLNYITKMHTCGEISCKENHVRLIRFTMVIVVKILVDVYLELA